METLSTLRAICDGNPSFTGGLPSQRAGNEDFDGFLSFKNK